LECSETSVFDPKTPVFASKTGFLEPITGNYFRTIFASLKRPDISKKFPNFDNRTVPKLTKTKSLENSVFRRALFLTTKFCKIWPPYYYFRTFAAHSAVFAAIVARKSWSCKWSLAISENFDHCILPDTKPKIVKNTRV